jgi:hypothetical protein
MLVAGVLGMMHRGMAFGRSEELRDEIRQSYLLPANAHLDISGLNGSVQVEISDTATTEVFVTRFAHSREDLENSISIEQTADGLIIRGQKRHLGLLHRLWTGEVSQNVSLKVPRNVDLAVHGVNGRVSVGDIMGPVKLDGVNGRVELAHAAGNSEISGVNGPVFLGITDLGDRGLRVSGVNGGVELRLASGLNADLDGHGVHGKVRSDAPNVNFDDDQRRSRFNARIGTGGAPITLSGINGGVKLVPIPTEVLKAE